MTQANLQATPSRAPTLIRMPGPMVNKFLEWGVPMGPNVLVTIRGRVSGEPRTQPLAIFSDEGRRWLIGTFGDTNWCRNLRANPDVEIRHGRHHEQLHARELPRAEAERFFSHDLPVGISHLPLYLRLFSRVFLRATAPVMKTDPVAAAAGHPVFELTTPGLASESRQTA
jgi:deazaflavin-dependent oxidoreductase (nitroreductase family)